MISLPRNVLYYGREKDLPEETCLQAGRLNATLVEGGLLSIFWDDYEILRRIYFATRDRNWGTVSAVIENLSIETNAEQFQVTYQARHSQGEIDVAWDVSITGTAAGALTFLIAGEARSTFLRNRIGFCLLHPAQQYAGRAFTVRQEDGSMAQGAFPEAIALEQPLHGTERMQGISFDPAPGLTAEIEFTGDVFQMEDQRNWTDASFKTFCTPLFLPYPVEVKKGTRISQRIQLQISDIRNVPHVRVGNPGTVLAITPHVVGKLPQLGIGMASHGQPLTQQEISRLKMLQLSHLRVDLQLNEANFADVLEQACSQAEQWTLPLEATLFLSNNGAGELQELRQHLHRLHPNVARFLVFHMEEKTTSSKWVDLARETLSGLYPATEWVAGTNAYFYQLAQNASLPDNVDSICYSIHPQEHAFDHRSVMETLEMQGETVHNLRQRTGNRKIIISPVTLKPRFNPNATGAISPPNADELPAQVDVRQMSLFGAAWTVGSLKSLAEAGIESATYYETTGWRGVMETASGSPLPQEFRSMPGGVFPLFHVMADWGEWKTAEIFETESSVPLTVTGLALAQNGRKRMLVANLTPHSQAVTIKGLRGDLRAVSYDESSILHAITSPEVFRAEAGISISNREEKLQLNLSPYAILRIDEVNASD